MHALPWTVIGQVATVGSVLLSAWRMVRAINGLRGDITQTFWEHRVMWNQWKKVNPVPAYPELETERDRDVV